MNFIDLIFNIPLGFIQSFFLLLFIRPRIIFSKGGTGALPVTYAARILGIGVFIHESDASAGKSNQIAAAWAKKIFTSFLTTKLLPIANVTCVGNPIRKEILEGNRDAAKAAFNLTFQKPIILFLGGSQGAEAINNFIFLALNNLLKDYEVIHVTGPKNFKKASDDARAVLDKNLEPYYHIVSSLDEIALKNAYAATDAIVSRAGAGSIFEIAALGKPSILVPLPTSARNHQVENAYQYAKSGACIVIEQGNLTPNFFLGELRLIVTRKEEMSQRALQFAKPEAAKNIAEEILQYLENTTIENDNTL